LPDYIEEVVEEGAREDGGLNFQARSIWLPSRAMFGLPSLSRHDLGVVMEIRHRKKAKEAKEQ
jgi:hypothetical protein